MSPFQNHPKFQTLTQRRDYLRERIKAKKVVGWETQWDERECESLSWLLDEASRLETALSHCERMLAGEK